MCEGYSLDIKEEARTGCVRGTPHIKKKPAWDMERNSRYREKSNELFLKRCVSSGSLSVSISVSRDLFVFVLFCRAFSKDVFIQILASSFCLTGSVLTNLLCQ